MADAAATLNLHGDQDGFTMRTFEACGVGAVQLIDRTDVGRALRRRRGARVVDLDRGAASTSASAPGSTVAWADGLRERGRRRTLAEHTFDHRVAVLEALWG